MIQKTWQRATSSSRQRVEWHARGADYDKVVQHITGMYRPITKWTGAQLKKLFRKAPQVWTYCSGSLTALEEYLREAQGDLEPHLSVSFSHPLWHLPMQLMRLWEHCGQCDAQLMRACPDMGALRDAIEGYRTAISFFASATMLAPIM